LILYSIKLTHFLTNPLNFSANYARKNDTLYYSVSDMWNWRKLLYAKGSLLQTEINQYITAVTLWFLTKQNPSIIFTALNYNYNQNLYEQNAHLKIPPQLDMNMLDEVVQISNLKQDWLGIYVKFYSIIKSTNVHFLCDWTEVKLKVIQVRKQLISQRWTVTIERKSVKDSWNPLFKKLHTYL